MAVYKYSSNINDKISKVCNDTAVQLMMDFPELDINDIEKCLDKLVHFLRTNHDGIGGTPYLLELDFFDTEAKEQLTSNIISGELKNKNSILRINLSLKVISAETFKCGFSTSELAMYSKSNNSVIAYMRNSVNLIIYSKGVPFKEIDVNNPTALPPIHDKFNHAADNYKTALKEFYNEKVRTNKTKHWAIKTKRILIPGQTEKHFQIALVDWLNDHLSSKKINYGTRKISNDETDIEIIRHGGETYILELKWMGENQSNTKYDIKKIEESFDQIENYIEGEEDVLEITLVAYDGRDYEDFKKIKSIEEKIGHWKEINECNSKTMHERASGLIFHLIHESASKRQHRKK